MHDLTGIGHQHPNRYTARFFSDCVGPILFLLLNERAGTIACAIEDFLHALLGRDDVILERRVALEIQLTVAPACQIRFIDDRYRLTDADHAVQRFDVFRVKPDAAVTDPHAHAIRLVSAVDQVAGHIELQHEMSERVIRPRRYHRWQRASHFCTFPADRRRDIPGGITRF